MESLSVVADEYMVTQSFSGFKFATRHAPLALESSVLECVGLPTMSSDSLNLNAGLFQLDQRGQSLFSLEQLAAITQIINAHGAVNNFEGEDDHFSCGDNGCRMYLDMKFRHSLSEIPPNLITELKDEDFKKVLPYQLACHKRTRKVYRRAFWLADGPGFGKTRILVGLMIDCRFRKIWRAVYFSKSQTSFTMLKREVEKFGFKEVEWHHAPAETTLTPGKLHVLLVKYSLLESPEQVVLLKTWMGGQYTDLILFDEFDAVQESPLLMQAVDGIQDYYPESRVVYSCPLASVTIPNYVLMWRLGLYGKKLQFETRQQFCEYLERWGQFGETQLMMELKMTGKITARVLSYQNTHVKLATAASCNDFQKVYDCCVDLWAELRAYLFRVIRVINDSLVCDSKCEKIKLISGLVSEFFSNRDDFFRELIVCMKLEEMEMLAEMALAKNMAVIVGVGKTDDKWVCHYLGKNKANRTFRGIAFSRTMMILRQTMVDLGIPIGLSKLHFNNGTVTIFAPGGDRMDQKLVSLELGSCKVEKFMPEIRFKKLFEDGKRVHDAFQRIPYWLPYSLGSMMEDCELDSPHQMCLWKPSANVSSAPSNVTAVHLARRFHQLYPFLPINAADQVRDRLLYKMKSVCEESLIVEATGSGYQTIWDKEEQTWETKAMVNVDREWSKFSNDEARVILIGDAYTSLPKLYCDSERQNARARAFIMMDFGQSVSEQMAVIGRVHACGQQKYASLTTTFFMITNTLADFKRMICLTHQLEAQGACVEHDDGIPKQLEKNVVLDVSLYSERGISTINEAAKEVFRKIPEFESWHQIVCPTDFPTRDTLEMTYCSKLNAEIFLSRLQCLPIAVQCSALNELDGQLTLTSKDNDTFGTFREIQLSKMYTCKIEDSVTLVNLPGGPCEMHLISVSRLNSSGMLKDFVEMFDCKYYIENDNIHSVCVAYFCRNQMLALYPYSVSPVPMSMSVWRSRGMKQIVDTEGKRAWLKELRNIEKKRNQCGHARLQEPDKCPILLEENGPPRKCLYLWGKTRFVILTGCFIRILDVLDEYGIPMQHGKVTLEYYIGGNEEGEHRTGVVDKTTFAGLYVGRENCDQSAKDVFLELKSLYG